MISNKYDLGCVLIGAGTSTFFTETMEKTVGTVIAMSVGTVVAFFLRRFLHKHFKNFMRNRKNN